MFEKKGKMGEESKRKTKRVVESLGWLTVSLIMPKKQRAIAGLGLGRVAVKLGF